MVAEGDDDEHALPHAEPYVRAQRTLARKWDAIVIGSGVGGLVAAGLLARAGGMRVLVLERHYTPGGLTQSFKRHGWEWDVGTHYVGDLGMGTPLRRLFDFLGDGAPAWAKLPARHDRVIREDGELHVGGDGASASATFARACPGEEKAIARYFDEVRACQRASLAHFWGRMREGRHDATADRSPFLRSADETTEDALRRFGASDALARLMTFHWTNYATPPDTSSFAAHAIGTAHYFSGAWTPAGGGAALWRALARGLVRQGGRLVVRAEVAAVLVADGRATGVRLADGRELAADVVVSDAGARTTYERLLDADAPGVGEMRERARAIGPSAAHVGLYLGLRGTPAELGLDGGNLWVDGRRGHAGVDVHGTFAPDAPPVAFYVSSAPACDPTLAVRMPGLSVLTGSTLAPYAAFAKWEATRWQRRDADYAALKDAVASRLLAALAAHFPRAAAAVEHVELSTPLSTRHFTAHETGEAAGLAHSPRRFRSGPFPASPIRGLYLAGQDVWLCGVAGAAFGGALAASTVLRRDLATELLR